MSVETFRNLKRAARRAGHVVTDFGSRSFLTVFTLEANRYRRDSETSISSRESLSLREHPHQHGDGHQHSHETSNSSIVSHEHCHAPDFDKSSTRSARRKLMLASVLCLIFMIGEVIGGSMAKSLAILTDAAHLLTDFASFMISLFSLWLASRPATKRMSFGWHRAEVIGALTSVIMIWAITGILIYEAIERIRTGQYDLDPVTGRYKIDSKEADIMLITAGVGVAFNIIMGITLHDVSHHHGHSHGHDHEHGHSHGHNHGSSQGSHSHSHDHGSHNHGHNHSHGHSHSHGPLDNNTEVSHSHVITAGPANGNVHAGHSHGHGANINVRAAFIHVLGDLFQSVGVLIAAYVIKYKPEWGVVDAICTFLFSILVLFTTVQIMRETLTVLMEGIPVGLDYNAIRDSLQSVPGVTKLHNLRIWALTMDKIALSAHLAIQPGAKTQEVLQLALIRLRTDYNIHEATLQVEDYHEMMNDCTRCKEPAD
ncbi:hypothetical protein RvY_15864-2 [Ramazzottius varieornatus]|uniref:Zinc transporter 2 n=1 Tax=Ramazzottius varieornatus TaxID=947166 RepID=A0A1D1W483_RAMVA|nr:hypothetical protein RvY_15864-2 [Ramazzottius varieornatus]